MKGSLALGFATLLLVAWSAQILDWKRVPGARNWSELKAVTQERDNQQPFESSGVPRSALVALTQRLEGSAKVFGTVAHTADADIDGARFTANVVFVEGDYFGAAGVALLTGVAPFPARGDAPLREAVVSSRVWRERFAADPHVVGRTFRVASRAMSGEPWVDFRVAGVANDDFQGIDSAAREDIWVTWGDWSDVLLPAIESHERVGDVHFPLRAGLSVSAGKMDNVGDVIQSTRLPGDSDLRHSRLVMSDGFGLDARTRVTLSEQSRLYRSASMALCAMLATGYFLWLRLQQVRTAGESAVRAVLGETAKRRFQRELGTNLVRVMPSLVAGAVLAVLALRAATLASATAPLHAVIAQFLSDINWPGLLALVAMAGLSLSVLGMERRTLFLRDPGSKGSGRLGHQRQSRIPLYVGFVALGLISALGLSELDALRRIVNAPLGFETANRYTMTIEPRDASAPEWFRYASRADARPMEAALGEALSADARVKNVSVSTTSPLGESKLGSIRLRDPRGGSDVKSYVFVNEVGAHFARLFDMHLAEGHMPSGEVPTEVAVSAPFASMYLRPDGSGSVLGSRFQLSTPIENEAVEVEVVGVVSSHHRITAKAAPSPVVYRPLRHAGAAWAISFEAAPESVASTQQRAGRVLADFVSTNWRLSPAQSLDAVVASQLTTDRWRAASIGGVLLLTVALGSLAFISAMRQWLLERGTEMAVRRALGATRWGLARAAIGIGTVQLGAMAICVLLLSTAVARWVKPGITALQAVAAAGGATLIMLLTVSACVAAAVSRRQERAMMESLRG